MLKRLRAARGNDDGFTLIELLLVIIILGVLAGIVVFAVNGIKDRGNASACKADKKNVEIASETYYSRHGNYAGSVAALVTDGLLREEPSTTNGYTIGYDSSNGLVSAFGACT